MIASPKREAPDEGSRILRYEEQPLNGVADLLEKLRRDEARVREELKLDGRIPIWFRGHSAARHRLESTLQRDGLRPELEVALMNRWKQNAGPFLDRQLEEKSQWEWMFLMRHHAAPSRLLDWTESALVGLYFALEKSRDPAASGDDGVLWMLLPTILNSMAHIKVTSRAAIPMFGENESSLDAYLPERLSNAGDGVAPAAGIGKRNSPRMSAQQGVFTIFHKDQRPLDDWHGGEHVWSCRIPAQHKDEIRQEMRRLGINRLFIYPDLDSVSQVAREALDA